ncbi:hypothetical protein N9H39_11055 [Gammaproteobacteria bacterium]|nr:hypothetical protein [Gammaproteobacteria bacterium]
MKGTHLIVLLLVAAVCSFDVSARTNVMLAVDVESLKHRYGNPRTDILGQLNGYHEAYSVPKILDILDEYDAKATFYLNGYEVSRFGDAESRAIANEIVQRPSLGQVVQFPEVGGLHHHYEQMAA